MLPPILHGRPLVIFITIFNTDDMLMMFWMAYWWFSWWCWALGVCSHFSAGFHGYPRANWSKQDLDFKPLVLQCLRLDEGIWYMVGKHFPIPFKWYRMIDQICGILKSLESSFRSFFTIWSYFQHLVWPYWLHAWTIGTTFEESVELLEGSKGSNLRSNPFYHYLT